MKRWLEENEEKRDTYHTNDVRLGKGITVKVARVVAATERNQRERWKADTEGVGLEAVIHAGLTHRDGPKKPEERQQLQPKTPLKSIPTPKPNPNQNLTPAAAPILTVTLRPRATSTLNEAMTSAPTTTRQLETVRPRNQQKLASPDPAPTTGLSMAERRLILRRDDSVPVAN